MCPVPNMAVFCSSLTSWFPGMLLTYFLNDFEMVPVAPIITGILLLLLLLLLCSTFYILLKTLFHSLSGSIFLICKYSNFKCYSELCQSILHVGIILGGGPQNYLYF
jgi:hypothetical protein